MKRVFSIGLFLCLFTALAVPPGALAEDGGNDVSLGVITVTGTREAEPVKETAATVNVVSGEEVRDVRPAHPSEIMDRTPGVVVNVTGGEGHTTAIRQPLTTSPVYLFLEDGIPVRSTGFFNHNALYEVNIPQSDGIEISKGPSTALYGSDSIGGVVNILTRPAPLKPEAELNYEMGSFGWRRLLLSGGNTWGDHGLRADVNVTHTDGWRDSTDYDRQSGTVRWDGFFSSGWSSKTVVTYSKIDQQTAGTSRISEADYLDNPTRNYTPISYRNVEALRVSAALEKESDNSLVSLTPFYRRNKLGYIANWSLSYDPAILDTSNDSFGLLAKYRVDLDSHRTRIVVGADIDHSPGKHWERRITPAKDGKVYVSYTENEVVYDYNATFQGISPYAHLETSPAEKLRLSAGVRYDSMSFNYDNKLAEETTGNYRKAADTKVSYSHLSPKLGATYEFSPSLNGFLSYRHAFRVPSESQLFRQGKTDNTIDLKPVKVDSYEIGLRRPETNRFYSEVSFYYMTKQDDILTYVLPDGSRETRNAGKTLHKGVELGLGLEVTPEFGIAGSYSYAEHTFVDWKPSSTVNYDKNWQSLAPRFTGNTRFQFRPAFLGGGKLELEWVHLGSYWMDDENTKEYPGHSLYNLRADYRHGNLTLFGRLMNVTNERWATAAGYSRFGGSEFAPGLPLTFYAGAEYRY